MTRRAALGASALVPLLLTMLLPGGTSDEGPTIVASTHPVLCTNLPPGQASTGQNAADLLCPPAIRPGARTSGCTLNWVVTDEVDLYIGTAAHCVRLGQRVWAEGIGTFGTVAMDGGRGDWAFVRIDDDRHHQVDPTLCRFGGPFAGPTGEAARDPLPGETIFHYGHGVAAGSNPATRARAGEVVLPWASPLSSYSFAFVGSVAGGDSGSPARLATGEAAGIIVAKLPLDPFPPVTGHIPTVAVATKITAAMADLEDVVGRPVRIVEGTVTPPETEDLLA